MNGFDWLSGGSAYPREWDYARYKQIADSVGALLMMDMAHISGLVAAGVSAFSSKNNKPYTRTKTIRMWSIFLNIGLIFICARKISICIQIIFIFIKANACRVDTVRAKALLPENCIAFMLPR